MIQECTQFGKREGLSKWLKYKLKHKKSAKQIFGTKLSSLEFCCVPSNIVTSSQLKLNIPNVVKLCCDFLRSQATHTKGIFRVSGSVKRIQALQNLFENHTTVDFNEMGFSHFDVAGVLTRFLNSLPEPVIPFNLFQGFRKAVLLEENDRINSICNLISQMPPFHSDLLIFLLDFLYEMNSFSEFTLMPIANLSAVFQPSVLSLKEHMLDPIQYQISQSTLGFLISNFPIIVLNPSIKLPKKPSPLRRNPSRLIPDKKWLRRSMATSDAYYEFSSTASSYCNFSNNLTNHLIPASNLHSTSCSPRYSYTSNDMISVPQSHFSSYIR